MAARPVRKKSSRKKFDLTLLIFIAVFVLFGIAVFFLNKQRLTTKQNASSGKKVVAYLVYWDKDRGIASIQNNINSISEISPWAYRVNSRGGIDIDPADSGNASAIVSPTLVNSWHSQGKLVIPAIHNDFNGNWDWNVVHTIISDPTLMQTHITNIVNLVVNNNYDGIDIDYENSNNTADQTAYSQFISALASALHAKGKLLTVDVYGKTSDSGFGSWSATQDYASLGASADELRIFLYDYDLGMVGGISPMNWVNSSISYAVGKVQASKIIHGIPFYGMDWPGATGSRSSGNVLTHDQVKNLISTYHATPVWDSGNSMYYFTYNTSNLHTVWYANAQSTRARIATITNNNLAGISVWRLGGEDVGNWQEIQAAFGVVSPSTTSSTLPTPTSTAATTAPTSAPIPTIVPTVNTVLDTTPPTVQILAPTNGATLTTRKVLISVAAADNVAIQKIQIFVDNNSQTICNSNTCKYYWNAGKVTGTHVIKAVAYDKAGNTSSPAQITVYK